MPLSNKNWMIPIFRGFRNISYYCHFYRNALCGICPHRWYCIVYSKNVISFAALQYCRWKKVDGISINFLIGPYNVNAFTHAWQMLSVPNIISEACESNLSSVHHLQPAGRWNDWERTNSFRRHEPVQFPANTIGYSRG